MNWSALANEKCPRCNAPLLERGMLDSHRFCSDSHCLFKIDVDKADKIAADTRRKQVRDYDPDENLSALNNL